ncbi:Hypothetical protein D9617_1g081700 [Elsinoe fawcettii]|nr:Hypothetical protein D9617_1g081700 [Elsinoe fawcettii]
MDPIVQQTRTKHERQKSKPKGEGMTALQHDIVNNPYAQIFLTPLRQDALTDLLLPRFFLQSFATAFPQQEKQASKTNAATSPFPFPSSPSSPCPFNPTEEPPLPTRHKPLLIPSSPSTTGQKSHVHLPLTSLEALHSSKRWKVMVPQSLEKTFGVDRKHWSFPLPQARAEMERGCRVGALQALGDLGTGGGLDSIAGGGGEEGDVEGERNVGATGKERAAGNGQETEKRALVVLSPPPDADMAVDQWITEVVSRSSGGRAGKEWCFFLPALLGRDEKGVQRLERFRDWIMESMAEGSGSSLSSTAGDELLAVTFKIEARTMKALLALMRWEMLYSESGRWDIVEKEKLWRRWTDGSRRDGDRASRPLIKP